MSAGRVSGVLLTGEELVLAGQAVHAAQLARRRNGHPPDPRLDHLAAVMAGTVRSDMPAEPVAQAEDVIGIAELAQLLNISDRHARRLAPGLDGRQVNGRWVILRSAVDEHLEGGTLV